MISFVIKIKSKIVFHCLIDMDGKKSNSSHNMHYIFNEIQKSFDSIIIVCIKLMEKELIK